MPTTEGLPNSPAGAGLLSACGQEQVGYLLYHEVEPDGQDYLYHVSCTQFEEHLAYLQYLNRRSRTLLLPVITFDDGHGSHCLHVAPLLQKLQIQAFFFITAGWIGERARYMSWAQVRELVAQGHRIGSHSWSHPFLPHCSNMELDRELRISKQVLEDALGMPVDAISMPGGRWNRRVLEACAEAGYTQVFTSDPWVRQRRIAGVEIYGRLNVTRMTSPKQLRNFLTLDAAWLRRCRIRAGARELVRGIIGDRVYHELWRILNRHQEQE